MNNSKLCPKCGTRLFITAQSTYFCPNCGCIAKEELFYDIPEYNNKEGIDYIG